MNHGEVGVRSGEVWRGEGEETYAEENFRTRIMVVFAWGEFHFVTAQSYRSSSMGFLPVAVAPRTSSARGSEDRTSMAEEVLSLMLSPCCAAVDAAEDEHDPSSDRRDRSFSGPVGEERGSFHLEVQEYGEGERGGGPSGAGGRTGDGGLLLNNRANEVLIRKSFFDHDSATSGGEREMGTTAAEEGAIASEENSTDFLPLLPRDESGSGRRCNSVGAAGPDEEALEAPLVAYHLLDGRDLRRRSPDVLAPQFYCYLPGTHIPALEDFCVQQVLICISNIRATFGWPRHGAPKPRPPDGVTELLLRRPEEDDHPGTIAPTQKTFGRDRPPSDSEAESLMDDETNAVSFSKGAGAADDDWEGGGGAKAERPPPPGGRRGRGASSSSTDFGEELNDDHLDMIGGGGNTGPLKVFFPTFAQLGTKTGEFWRRGFIIKFAQDRGLDWGALTRQWAIHLGDDLFRADVLVTRDRADQHFIKILDKHTSEI